MSEPSFVLSTSVLDSVKKQLGLSDSYTAFDPDIIMGINSVFLILNQLGVGPANPFSIEDNTAEWDDFFDGNEQIELVKSYMYLKVRLIFDPPSTGVLHEAMERQIQEFEWRLNVYAETGQKKKETLIPEKDSFLGIDKV